MIDLERDKELVAAATDGDWNNGCWFRQQNYRYIEQFQPSYITEYHDHIEAQAKRVEELEYHLNRALKFISHTDAFGGSCETGAIQAGEDESTLLDIDAAKQLLSKD